MSDPTVTKSRIRSLFPGAALLLALAALTVWRQPELLTQPRFWAEEGAVYFPYAFAHSFLENLFHPEFGYNTLYHSIVTSLATLVPLEKAPLVTTWAAFAVQMGVGAMVVRADIPLLDTLWKRAALLFLIPLVCYARNWLNTVGVQYWLCILSFLVLMEEPSGGGRFRPWGRAGMLVMGGLTGITSCLMTPVFFLKWLRTRSTRFLAYTAILTVCSFIQIGIFLSAYLGRDAGVGMRFVRNEPMHLLSKVLSFQFAEPFLGVLLFLRPSVAEFGDRFNERLSVRFGATPFHGGPDLLGDLAGGILLLFVVYLFIRKFREPDFLYAGGAFLFVFIFSTFLSVNMSAGPRYTFAPNAMLVLFMIGVAGDARLRFSRKIAMALLAFSLVIHLVEYRSIMQGFAYSDQWPKWEEEVRYWRLFPGYQPRIWPPDWKATLTIPAERPK